MTQFKAIVTQDVAANRLLSLSGGNGVPTISITELGGTPDFRSTGPLTEGQEVYVTIRGLTKTLKLMQWQKHLRVAIRKRLPKKS